MCDKDNISDNDKAVYYCTSCMSLAIIADDDLGDYCKDCGSTSISKTTIEDWEKKLKEKFPKKWVLHSRNIFEMPKRNEYYNK